jgi:peptidoglycan/LPS O-acetylase OafA/YrhL
MAFLFGMLILSSASLDRRIPLLCTAPMVALGEASYALYILHMPLLFWWTKGEHLLRLAMPPAVDIGLYSISCIIASLIIWKFWEVPLRRRLYRASSNA